MKRRLLNCPYCKKETKHLVKKKVRARTGGGAVTIYKKFHCCKCNVRRDKA